MRIFNPRNNLFLFCWKTAERAGSGHQRGIFQTGLETLIFKSRRVANPPKRENAETGETEAPKRTGTQNESALAHIQQTGEAFASPVLICHSLRS